MALAQIGESYEWDAYPEFRVAFIIDNDAKKTGISIQGKEVKAPHQINDWSDFFIIIVNQYYDEISKQLGVLGMCYKETILCI